MLRIKELRKEKNITLKKLADYLHTGTSTVSQYENGKREASFETINKLADFFDVSLDYLMGRTDKRNDNEDINNLPEEGTVTVWGYGTGKTTVKFTKEEMDIIDALIRNRKNK